MSECFKCGISEDKVRLFDAISGKGIVKICKECSSGEDIPVIKRPSALQLETEKPTKSVYERLATMSGINAEEHKKKISNDEIKKREFLEKQEITLRDIVDRNFQKTFKQKAKPREGLIDNFHWIIMRARRAKKLTQEQLAREIAEAEATIKMVEQGILPEDAYGLINKLEDFLKIMITKRDSFKQPEQVLQEQSKKVLDFDPITTKALTISDLQEMKKEKGAEIFEAEETKKEEIEETIDGEELNIEEIEDIEEELPDEDDDLVWKK